MPIDIDYLTTLLNEMNSVANVQKVAEVVKVEPVARPKRCQGMDCKAKLVLSDFACQCKGFYCSKHRYAEAHSCAFDYKAAGNKLLEKNLVKAVADKLDRV